MVTADAPPRRWAWRVGTLAVLLALPGWLLSADMRVVYRTAVGDAANAAPETACLPGQPVEIMDSPYISPAEADSVMYLSSPPTSGPQYPFTVATGVYDGEIENPLAVAALAHGHIVIRYAATTPTAEVAALTRLAKRHGADVVLAPDVGLSSGIALTAWGRIDRLDYFDPDRIATFVLRLSNRYNHGWTSRTGC